VPRRRGFSGPLQHNFAIPTQLKAWIDRVAQVGRTFTAANQAQAALAA